MIRKRRKNTHNTGLKPIEFFNGRKDRKKTRTLRDSNCNLRSRRSKDRQSIITSDSIAVKLNN